MSAPASQTFVRTVELSVQADTGDIRTASSWLDRVGAEHGIPSAEVTRLDQCLDEALANVIAHGGPSARAAPIDLVFRIVGGSGDGEAALTVIDAGVAFDPVAARPKPGPGSLEDAVPGGLGLTLMRSFADELSYRLDAGRNHLTFCIRWRAPPGGIPE